MKKKPQYNVWENICFMLKNAIDTAPSVIFQCLAFAAVEVALNLTGLFVTPTVLSRVETRATIRDLLGTIALFTLLLVGLNALRRYLDEINIYGRISVRKAIIKKIIAKNSTTSYPNTRDPKVMELREQSMDYCGGNDVPTEYIWNTLTVLITDIAGFLIYVALLSDLNPGLLILIAVTAIVGFLINNRLNGWGYRHREEFARYEKEISYIYSKTESRQLAKDIRIFGLADWLRDIFNSSYRMLAAFLAKRERIYSLTCVVDVLLQLLRNGIAYGYLIRLALTQGMAASQFLLYFTAFTGFSNWITQLFTQMSELHKESLGLSVVQEYLNYPELFRFEGGQPIPEAAGYELKLEDVSFSYPGGRKKIFDHLNLTIHPGEKLAVVGLNGAGKTTLVKLLCGFYDPDEGRVLLNGEDVRSFNRQEYYDLFSAVFQDMSVLDITIAQTVAQCVDGYDMERVKACIDKAGMLEKIEALPQGFDTHVGRNVYYDGMEFSGGETQRLMLARALYKNGAVLVLDEPTAALDPIAENDIYRKYNDMAANKTSIFISHRLASTRFCDRILFMKEGRIEEEGTHEELLAKKGGYAKLFHVQARYYQEGREFDGEAIG